VQKTKEDFQPGATLKNVRANDDVDLKGHNMKGIKIVGGNMVSVDLRGADLSGATLENIMFNNAKLDGANLTGATIRGCMFEDASVKEARFSGTHHGVRHEPVVLCGQGAIQRQRSDRRVLQWQQIPRSQLCQREI
jgi:hypothetical protein